LSPQINAAAGKAAAVFSGRRRTFMSRLLVSMTIGIAIIAAPLEDANAESNKHDVVNATNVGAGELAQLSERMPDADQVLAWYREAGRSGTIGAFSAANEKLKGAVAHATAVETVLIQLHEAATSCPAEPIPGQQIQVTAIKMQSLQSPLDDIATRMKKTVDKMVEQAGPDPGMMPTKAVDLINDFKKVQRDYSEVRLRALEISKALTRLARDIPATIRDCILERIPDLFAGEPPVRPITIVKSAPLPAPNAGIPEPSGDQAGQPLQPPPSSLTRKSGKEIVVQKSRPKNQVMPAGTATNPFPGALYGRFNGPVYPRF
jgi:hypothetical protein